MLVSGHLKMYQTRKLYKFKIQIVLRFTRPVTQISLLNISQQHYDKRRYSDRYKDGILIDIFLLFYQCTLSGFSKYPYSGIQSEYRKIRTRKNSIFGQFSRSVSQGLLLLGCKGHRVEFQGNKNQMKNRSP